MSALPAILSENAGLAFVGEAPWLPAVVTSRQAKTLAEAHNPAGRPNSDVLRSFVGKAGRHVHEHWQIDFPAHYREQEAALHVRPFALLQKNFVPGPDSWWKNPHAGPSLRNALARLDRFLATALDAVEPAWSWFESEYLPDSSLLVVARDNDFTHAVLESAAFGAWWHEHRARLQSPTRIIESFPFPWPPAMPLGSLTKTQQDLRSAATRAVLSGDNERINAAVCAAYGWSGDWNENEILAALQKLHFRRLPG